MNILLCSNRYFLSGGPERYLFGVEARLREAGHEVMPFAMRYARNRPSPYASYFAPHPVDERYVYFGDLELSAVQKMRLLGASLYNREVYRAARRAMRELKINLVYALQVTNFLSPGVFLAARDEGIPVVYRQSDFHLVCPSYHMFRDGRACEECLAGLRHAIRHRCLKNSYLVTAARVAGMKLEKLLGVDNSISKYVTPTRFMKDILLRAGFAESKLAHVPTAVEIPRDAEADPAPGNYVLYAGNLAPHKGVKTLLHAMAGLPGVKLKVAGRLGPDERAEYFSLQKQLQLSHVEFLDFCEADALGQLYQNCRAFVFPSLWYENMPNAVLEAMACGRPVITSNLGSLPELVQDGENGLLVPPGDAHALAGAIRKVTEDRELAARMGLNSLERVKRHHTWEHHMETLMDLFQQTIGEHKRGVR